VLAGQAITETLEPAVAFVVLVGIRSIPVQSESMSDDDYYRRQAAEAQQHADRSLSGADRASWLRIAQSWLGLIRGNKPTAQESAQEDFDRGAREQGTHQDISKDRQ
jgi:hypothetical protein